MRRNQTLAAALVLLTCSLLGTARVGAAVLDVSSRSYDSKILKSEMPAVVEVWASWCSSCRAMEPVLEDLSAELAGKAVLAKLDFDRHPGFALRRNIDRLPTFILVVGGKEVRQIEGYLNRPRLRALLAGLMDDPGDDGVVVGTTTVRRGADDTSSASE